MSYSPVTACNIQGVKRAPRAQPLEPRRKWVVAPTGRPCAAGVTHGRPVGATGFYCPPTRGCARLRLAPPLATVGRPVGAAKDRGSTQQAGSRPAVARLDAVAPERGPVLDQ